MISEFDFFARDVKWNTDLRDRTRIFALRARRNNSNADWTDSAGFRGFSPLRVDLLFSKCGHIWSASTLKRENLRKSALSVQSALLLFLRGEIRVQSFQSVFHFSFQVKKSKSEIIVSDFIWIRRLYSPNYMILSNSMDRLEIQNVKKNLNPTDWSGVCRFSTF